MNEPALGVILFLVALLLMFCVVDYRLKSIHNELRHITELLFNLAEEKS